MTEVPADLGSRVVVFLDCGNIDRAPEALRDPDLRILNVDHHHDNTRFGTIDHVVPEASCTAEIVWDLMRSLGVEATPEIADALYVGLVTDTGKFMYENTGTRAHVMAAELIAAGRRRPRDLPPPVRGHPVGQAAAAGARARRGAPLRRRPPDAEPADARDVRRGRGGGQLLGGHRRPPARRSRGRRSPRSCASSNGDGATAGRRSRCAPPTRTIDVSAIARAGGGGGHRQAAGFTTQLPDDQLVAFLRDAVAAQLAALPDDHSSR